jgi:hypothetical protein
MQKRILNEPPGNEMITEKTPRDILADAFLSFSKYYRTNKPDIVLGNMLAELKRFIKSQGFKISVIEKICSLELKRIKEEKGQHGIPNR